MNTSIRDLIYNFKNQNILMQLIVVLAGIFVFLRLAYLLLFFFGLEETYFVTGFDFLTCTADLEKLIFQPWTIFTYMFMHFDIWHVVFNLLVLYWFGKIFLEYIGARNFLSVFILGGLAGAALYIISYNLFPAFADSVRGSNMLGASAGVLAILVAIATFVPNYTFHLMFIGPVKIKYIAAVLVFIYLIVIPFSNAGGNLAHIGGAIFGYFYATQYKKGKDYASGLTNFTDKIFAMFSGSGNRMKTVYKKTKTEKQFHNQKADKQEIIDKILDKISKSGYGSLSEEEKKTLFNASKN